MKKAVVKLGSSQYVVAEGDQLKAVVAVDDKKSLSISPLLVIDDSKVSVGAPNVASIKVQLEVVDANAKGDKVTAVRYKAKKRVLRVKGHKQAMTELKVTKIA